MRCRICGKEIVGRNRSLVKGICKLDFRYGSAAQAFRLDERRYQGRILHDTAPSPTPALFASHIEALDAKPEYEYEADLSKEEVKLLGQIRRKRITRIQHPMPFNESSLVPPSAYVAEEVEVELDGEEVEMLKRMRILRKWEGRG